MNARMVFLGIMACWATAVSPNFARGEPDDAATSCARGRCQDVVARAESAAPAAQRIGQARDASATGKSQAAEVSQTAGGSRMNPTMQVPDVRQAHVGVPLPAGSWQSDPSILEPCWGAMFYLLSC